MRRVQFLYNVIASISRYIFQILDRCFWPVKWLIDYTVAGRYFSFNIFKINFIDSIGLTPLQLAVIREDYTAITALIRLGANVNQPFCDMDKQTPLHWAVVNSKDKDIRLLSVLLDSPNIDIQAKDSLGKTFIDYACRLKKHYILHFLHCCRNKSPWIEQQMANTCSFVLDRKLYYILTDNSNCSNSSSERDVHKELQNEIQNRIIRCHLWLKQEFDSPTEHHTEGENPLQEIKKKL